MCIRIYVYVCVYIYIYIYIKFIHRQINRYRLAQGPAPGTPRGHTLRYAPQQVGSSGMWCLRMWCLMIIVM